MRLLAIFIFLLLFCCQTKEQTNIKLINGQWEITEVKMSDGYKKKYTINEFIDFYDINKGIKMKLKADLMGNFTSTQVADSVFYKNDLLHVITPFDTMVYEIETLTDQQLILVDKDENNYIYKKYKKLNLN